MTLRWSSFLDTLPAALDVLERRFADNGPSPVVYRTGAQSAAADEILVGLGRWQHTTDAGGSPRPVPHPGVCLGDKDAAGRTGRTRPFAGVTDLVLGADDDLWREWRSAAADTIAPDAFLRRFTVVAEDASPDSCFGLITFLARLAGVPAADLPPRWISCVRRWEQGDSRAPGGLGASWGTLHNALAHSHFAMDGELVDATRDAALARAWLACLRFDVGALRADADPDHLDRVDPWPELLTARSALTFEEQQYRHGIDHAVRLQLLVPMATAPDRRQLVDAYLEEEVVLLGAKKLFLRNDRDNTWLHNGFGLIAFHRPALHGSGSDIVVSVDPDLGIQLRDLWCELERLENERWAGARPCDDPRRGIIGYEQGWIPGNAPNQPWYDERGRFTLIAAPKRVTVDKVDVPGSRLGWDDVCEALWRLYPPHRGLRVTDDSTGRAGELADCTPTDTGVPGSDKRLLIAHWRAEEAQAIPITPTLERYMAAIVAAADGSRRKISLRQLVAEGPHQRIELAGGFAIVTRNGAFLLDDWRSQPLEIEALRDEFRRAVERLAAIERLTARLHELLPPGAAVDPRLLHVFPELRLEITRQIGATLPQATSPSALAFRAALEHHWGTEHKLEVLRDAIGDVETALRDKAGLRTTQLLTWISLYAFPAVFLASFFSFVVADLPAAIPWGEGELGSTWGGIHWLGLGLYAALTVLLILFLRLATGADRRPPD